VRDHQKHVFDLYLGLMLILTPSPKLNWNVKQSRESKKSWTYNQSSGRTWSVKYGHCSKPSKILRFYVTWIYEYKITNFCWITSSKCLLLNPGEYLGQRSPYTQPFANPRNPRPFCHPQHRSTALRQLAATIDATKMPIGHLREQVVQNRATLPPVPTCEQDRWAVFMLHNLARLKQTAGSARKLVEHCLETCVLEDALQLKTKQEGTSRTIAASSSKSQPHPLSSEGSCEPKRCVEDPKLWCNDYCWPSLPWAKVPLHNLRYAAKS